MSEPEGPGPNGQEGLHPSGALARLPWLELGLLIGVGLFALVFQVRLPGRQVTERDYQQLTEILRAEAQPGDVVLLFPWWTERARLYVPDGLRVVGYQGSDSADLLRHPRVWVIAQPEVPGASMGAFQKAFAPGREQLAPPRSFGNLQLWLYANGRHRPLLFSATEALSSARVYLESPSGERVNCAFDGRAHRCPGRGNVRVSAEWHEVQFEARRCLWMQPPGGPARLVVEFPAGVASDALSLEAGLIWDRGYFGHASLTPVRIGVDDGAQGRPLMEIVLPPGREGLQRAKAEQVAVSPVRLWTQADNAELREVCVDLFGYGPARGEAR